MINYEHLHKNLLNGIMKSYLEKYELEKKNLRFVKGI